MSHTDKFRRLVPLVASLAFIAISLVPAHVVAQDAPCKVTLSALPAAAELKGFRMGMTMEQVKALVPQIGFGPTDDLGSSKVTINPAFDPRTDKSSFQDVRSISLDFLDGRIVSLWIGYDASFKWKTVDDFVRGISNSLALPNAWSPWKLRGKEMTCADFQLTVSLIAQTPSFRILDRTAEELLTARRIAKEEHEAAAAEAAEEADEIIGDRKTRTYYPSGCRPPNEIAEANRVSFTSIEEANKAGYKPAKGCM